MAAELEAKSVEVNEGTLKMMVPVLDSDIADELPKIGASYDRRLKTLSKVLDAKKNPAKAVESFLRVLLFDAQEG
jgi:hypothetical protein